MKFIYWLLILSLLITGCTSFGHYSFESITSSWKYSELRRLDPVDVPNPEQDILAVYTRIQGESFQIRLDFLDLSSLYGQDITILFDGHPGGTDEVRIEGSELKADIQWDYALNLPAKGNAVMLDHEFLPMYSLDLMTSRDVDQDYVVVSINKSKLPVDWNTVKIQAFTASPANSIVADWSQPVMVSALPPPRAEVIFLFWNVFSGETPARTLRSWYGAHSGPNSSRHGLKYILDAASVTQTPLFFLNFPSSDVVPGLDFIGVSTLIDDLIKENVINSIEMNNFDGYFVNNVFNLKSKYNIMLGDYDYTHYASNSITCTISAQLSYSLSNSSAKGIDCRPVLIVNALSSISTPIIIGGDLSKSSLGEPSTAFQLFLYFHNHPWIKIISPADFFSSYPSGDATTGRNENIPDSNQLLNQFSHNPASLPQEFSAIYKALLTAPDNQLTDHAIQTFAYLASFASPDLSALAANYVHQVGHILAAAKWVENPKSIASCDVDPDFDGVSECILSNQQVFLIVEPDGGYTPFIFSLDSDGPHQVTGPSWEFLIGMSDSSDWKLTEGVQSDPRQFLGVLIDYIDNNKYISYVRDNNVIIEYVDMPMRNSITINENTVQFQFQRPTQEMGPLKIPFSLDPWIRYTSNWGDKYFLSTHENGIHWGIMDGLSVDLLTTDPINTSTFNATHNDLFYPEDPNHDYTGGHYLPYPMAVFDILPSESIDVKLVINP